MATAFHLDSTITLIRKTQERLIIYIQIISNKNLRKPYASSVSEIPQEQPYLLWLHNKDSQTEASNQFKLHTVLWDAHEYWPHLTNTEDLSHIP